jgi:hypothetical protein
MRAAPDGRMITKHVTTIRSVDPVWQRYERRYFAKLLALLTPLQYPAGPVVVMQLGDDSDVPILKNGYYALMLKEFRQAGVHVPINSLINTGASGWWGHFNQADIVRLNDTNTFAAFVRLGPAMLRGIRGPI